MKENSLIVLHNSCVYLNALNINQNMSKAMKRAYLTSVGVLLSGETIAACTQTTEGTTPSHSRSEASYRTGRRMLGTSQASAGGKMIACVKCGPRYQ